MSQQHDPSVFNEPHMRPPVPAAPGAIPYASPSTPDPKSIDFQQDVRLEPLYGAVPSQPVDHAVWDEPALSPELSGSAAHQQGYASCLREQVSRWTSGQSWLVTIGLALIAGPFAIVGAFWGAGLSLSSVVMVTVLGPLTEEILKIAAPTLAVETRPYVFRSGFQIILCGFCGGLAFAAIENLLYLFVYIPNPPSSLVLWRWTVCVAMHTCCSTIAAMGVQRVWKTTMTTGTRPRLSLAFPAVIVAAVVHGLYNAMALVLEAAHLF